MEHLKIKADECGYKERDIRLKEQLINGINDNYMMTQIIKEVTTIKKTNDVT